MDIREAIDRLKPLTSNPILIGPSLGLTSNDDPETVAWRIPGASISISGGFDTYYDALIAPGDGTTNEPPFPELLLEYCLREVYQLGIKWSYYNLQDGIMTANHQMMIDPDYCHVINQWGGENTCPLDAGATGMIIYDDPEDDIEDDFVGFCWRRDDLRIVLPYMYGDGALDVLIYLHDQRGPVPIHVIRKARI